MRSITRSKFDESIRSVPWPVKPTAAHGGMLIANIEDLEARRLAHVSRGLRSWVSRGAPVFIGPGLALVTEWGVWESSELMPLFKAWRFFATNCAAPLADVPGFEFEPGSVSDAENAACLLAMAITFGWGIVMNDQDQRLEIDHDGNVRVMSSDDASIQRARAIFQGAGDRP